jgi:hypothetical protein
MTETLHRSAGRRCGRGARVLTAGVLACGAVLLPTATASADHMVDMNGMMCPHAIGDPTNPATAAPPTRSAPNEAPLGAKPSSVVTQPSAGQAATKPASNPSAQRASATQPASTTANAKAGAGAVVNATQPQRAATPVAQPQRAATPVAQPQHIAAPVGQRTTVKAASKPASKQSAPARHAQAPRLSTVIPEVTRPSAGSAPQVTSAPAGTEQGSTGWLAIGGLLALIASAALVVVLVLRRRGNGDAAVAAITDAPLEPAMRAEPAMFDEVEVALQEMIAEARAHALLDADGDTDTSKVPVVTG